MRAQVSKWGNSLAIRLPKAAAESLSIKEGQAVDLTIEGDCVIIRSGRPRYSIKELVARMEPGKEPESFDDVNALTPSRE